MHPNQDTPVKRYHIQTYGCQMNEHDSEVLAGILESMGYQSAEQADHADLIILNTCCVRASAEERVLGELGRLKIHKYRNPDVILGICGCMPMEVGAAERIIQRAPHVDLVFGTSSFGDLRRLLEEAQHQRTVSLDFVKQGQLPDAALPRKRVEGVHAWVPIIYGCDNYCSYCIVPYVRGRERSRPAEDILLEVQELVDAGVRVVTLLGQNVNSYGKDLPGHIDFGQLLQQLNVIADLRWIRYTTSHPRDFSLQLVEQIAQLDKVCEHFHLPVQSGSNRILQLMNRGYTREQYVQLIAKIRETVPRASITTDVIVGFPGETEEDFQETYRLFQEVGYDSAFAFLYSPRPGTEAAKLPDQIPLTVKKERLLRLNELQYQQSRETNERVVGDTLCVLFEERSSRNPRIWRGRTRNNKLVLVEDEAELAGHFAPVLISAAETFQLRGCRIADSTVTS